MYEWIAETFGVGDGIARAMSFIIALAIVFGLIGLVLFVLRQLTGNRISTGRNRQPRIAVMDAMHIDQRRRLLLVRRDNVEHLILVGGPTDVVVEQAIVRGNPVSASYPRGGQPAGQPAPQYGSPPFEGEPEPYAAQPNWPTAPVPAAAASAPAQQSPQMAAAPAAPMATAPVAAAPSAAVVHPAPQQMAEITPHASSDLGSAPGQERSQAAAPVQPRPSSLRQTAQEAALAALRSRNNSPRIEPAQAARDSDDIDNVKALRPRIAALTEPLRRSTPQPAQAPAQAASQPAVPAAPPVAAPRPSANAGDTIAAAASTLTSKAGASVAAAGAAVADLARSLSKSSERVAAPAEPEVRRQLTPPSSGPAARARTAFPNGMPTPQPAAPAATIDPAPVAAVEPAAEAEVQAPVVTTAAPAARAPDVSPAPVAAAAPAVAAPAVSAPNVTAPTSVKTFGGFPAQPRPQPAVTATPDVSAPRAPAVAPVIADVSLNLSAPAASMARPVANLSTDVRLTPLVATPPVAANAATTAEDAAPDAGTSDDIFEMDVRPEPKPASAETVASAATLAALTVGEEIEVATPTEAPTSKLSQVIPEIRLTAADLQEPVAEAPEVVVPAVEAPAATRDEAGVNAIEEEMARLLSEIGVQGRK